MDILLFGGIVTIGSRILSSRKNKLGITRKELSEKPWHIEGKTNSEWVLLDYINVVAHIFYKDARPFYDLEDLWADAKRTDIPNLN